MLLLGLFMVITFLEIPDLLIEQGIVGSTSAANSAAFYAARWAYGEAFDLSKSQVSVNRARLRKIGIDIAKPYVSPSGEVHKLAFQTNVKGFD